MSQVFVPMLTYEDGIAAIDWLSHVFGMAVKEKCLDEDGQLSHGELEYAGQRIMLASPTPLYQSPKTLRQSYVPALELSKLPYVMDGVLIRVSDLSAILERALANGGVALSEIQTGFPGTRVRIEDPEGHQWYLLQMD